MRAFFVLPKGQQARGSFDPLLSPGALFVFLQSPADKDMPNSLYTAGQCEENDLNNGYFRSGFCSTCAAIFTYHLNMNSGDIMSKAL